MMIHSLPARRAVPTHRASRQPGWQTSVVALAAALLLGAASGDANALALGRINVQSALGEPLRAEVELPQVTAEELATLKATVASPQVFQAAGVEYNHLLDDAQIVLQRRADGSPFLRVTSDRAINEPFLDLIVEANWASGRIVRDFTLLFDPPRTHESEAPLAAQVPAPAAAQPRVEAAAPATTARPGVRPSNVPPAASPAPAGRAARSRARTAPQAPVASGPAASAPAQGKEQVTVQPGQTAGSIAAAHLPPAVSLDQMLVALLRSNPDAFAGGNVNRLRSGAVLELPSSEQAAAVPRGQARETLVAQSRDFNQFRQRLAEQPGTAPQVAQAGRTASGRVQAQVEEKSSAPPTPDKLTLSKGALQGRRGETRAAEDRIARERAAQDRATRMAELDKNIAELSRLNAAAGVPASPASGAARTPAGVGIAAPPPVTPPAATASEPATSASAPASSVAQAASAPASAAASAASAASTPTATAPVARASAPRKPVAVPALPEQPGMLEQLSENPLIPAGVGALVAALLGWGLYRIRQQHKKAQQVDSSFLESRIQHDSFFGASGGQRIDTAEGSTGVTGTSMVYSPSQLDAAGDVDPVAEADVYLAYGRDLQAEEILKEALRTNPQRIAIHSKLLEIYARRRDAKAFELVASEAHALTQGTGTEWTHIARMGLEIDPQNPLYQTEGWTPGRAALPAAAAAAAVAAQAAQPRHEPDTEAMGSPSSMPHDLDLDLGSPFPAPSAKPAPLIQPAGESSRPSDLHELDLDISAFGDEDNEAAPAPSPLAASPAEPARGLPEDLPDLELPGHTIEFDMPDEPISAASSAPAVVPPAPAPAPSPAPEGLMDFDLGGLSLDLPSIPAAAPAPEPAGELPDLDFDSTATPADDAEDPLATKLALAEEFHSIGDSEGARSLAQEVLSEAQGDLKKRAERLLADIG